MRESRVERPSDGVVAYGLLACAITWALATPLAWAWFRKVAPPPIAIPFAGLSAFGPLFAALLVARWLRVPRPIFGPFRAPIGWVVLALFAPAAIHLVATVLFVAIGGKPLQWFHPPLGPEQVAALVVFPLGEEFGWRGFAHPRLTGRFGLVKGSLVVGLLWGIWHLAYSVPPAGGIDGIGFAMMMVQLPLYSLLIAWVFERAGRGMLVAIAFHAGAHLDHIELAPRTDMRLHYLHLGVVAVLSIFAARSLSRPRAE